MAATYIRDAKSGRNMHFRRDHEKYVRCGRTPECIFACRNNEIVTLRFRNKTHLPHHFFQLTIHLNPYPCYSLFLHSPSTLGFSHCRHLNSSGTKPVFMFQGICKLQLHWLEMAVVYMHLGQSCTCRI